MAESEAKLYSFVETPVFIRQLDRKALLDLLIEIQNDLLKDPRRGDVVSGTDGARKARIADANESRGKRGSYRYLYLYLEQLGESICSIYTPRMSKAICYRSRRN